MQKLLLLPFLLLCCQLSARIFPEEGGKLNYRVIGFVFPEHGNCSLEIASGNDTDAASFKRNIIKSFEGNNGNVIAEVPSFGSNYTWRLVCSGQPGMQPADLHHFSTLSNPNVDTSKTRLRIISNAGKYHNGYVFADGTQTLYDLDGNPVWFVPGLDSIAGGNANVRDLKLTSRGTITFMTGNEIREIDYNGNILWKGPGGGKEAGEKSERYHHEFTRLSNGHYMVLGNEQVMWELPQFHEDTSLPSQDGTIVKDSNNVFAEKMQFGTVIEYDQDGKEVWQWKSSDYFKGSDLYTQYLPGGKFPFNDVHENSFFFDEKKKILYVGFRDISRILKVKYPEGKVIAVYGNKYEPGAKMGNDLFCGQHSIRLSDKGNLCLFNNNAINNTSLPKIELLKEPVNGKGELGKIWEYQCTLDGMNPIQLNNYNRRKDKLREVSPKSGAAIKARMSSGGAATELPDGSFFACMSGSFCKIFIVDKNGKIMWSAIPEKKSPQKGHWATSLTYRASIIFNNADFFNLIQNASKYKNN